MPKINALYTVGYIKKIFNLTMKNNLMLAKNKKRLAIFLDGTWNTEEDSTNVRNAYHLTLEGQLPGDGVIQERYYDRGVGTGMFDGLLGGGFGYGLEDNVLEAYNWLLDHYNDKDEIYIFGFSRGAYTARSLVGLIASCGLIRRGAPLTVKQLWKGYTFNSKNRRRNEDWWKKVLAKDQDKFRRINNLAKDYWEKEEERKLQDPVNNAEKLLIEWSRRVKITYLGIFDTVGAMGKHALGIGGLRSRMAEIHNTNPSKILQHCRHALAIDEHRTSFRLTPILDFVNNSVSEDKKYYQDIIEQRWFVGAHSNIGGGYANNFLSMRPLQWMLEGARNAGLKTLELPKNTDAIINKSNCLNIRDSYSELGGSFWPNILREKRYHRQIGRSDLIRSDHTLRPINEVVDETVFDLVESDENYAPPNLIAYAAQAQDEKLKQELSNRVPQQRWPGDRIANREKNNWFRNWVLNQFILVLWCIFAAYGIITLLQLLGGDSFPLDKIGLPVLAALYVLLDWGEAKSMLQTALYPKAVIPRVMRNVLSWLRFFGILTFFIGLFRFFVRCYYADLTEIVSIPTLTMYIWNILMFFYDLFLIPFLAATTMVVILSLFGRFLTFKSYKERPVKKMTLEEIGKNKNKVIKMILAIAISILALVVGINHWLDAHLTILSGSDSYMEDLAGKLILVQMLVLIFIATALWVGKPMGSTRANIGSILHLQMSFTKTQINELFNSWLVKLSPTWIKDIVERRQAAWQRLRELLRETLWRDNLGFLPVYCLTLGGILFIGKELEFTYSFFGLDGDNKLLGISSWIILVGITAVTDIVENTIHLQHVKNYPRGGSPNSLVLFGVVFIVIKFICFVSLALISLAIFWLLTWEVASASHSGWKWFIANGITCTFLIIIILQGIRLLREYRLSG